MFNGYRVPIEEDENVLELTGSDGCTTLNILKAKEQYLKMVKMVTSMLCIF